MPHWRSRVRKCRRYCSRTSECSAARGTSTGLRQQARLRRVFRVLPDAEVFRPSLDAAALAAEEPKGGVRPDRSGARVVAELLHEARDANEFNSYLLLVVPAGVPPVQIQETQRAFYAGAAAAFALMNRIGEDDVPEHVGVVLLERLDRELKVFTAKVEAGKA